VTRLSLLFLWEEGIPLEGEDDYWVGEAMVLHVTTLCTVFLRQIRLISIYDTKSLKTEIIQRY
jgi:hypothetical protein